MKISLNRGFNGKINCKWWMDLHVSFETPVHVAPEVSLCCLGTILQKKML